MKKYSIFMALAVVALGFASCSEDKDPVFHAPTEFVLNTPALQDQYIDLEAGSTLELVTSQPDYGYSAVANYAAQMSLTEDFADFRDLVATDNHQARIALKQEDIALGLCELLGIDSEDSFAENYPNGLDYEKVYFRAVCQLEGVENSLITSNVVAFNNIKGYFAVKVPGYIYLVGSPEGWAGPTEANAAHYAEWRLFEPATAIGSKVYSGVFDLPAAPMFRFYTALTGWDADSYGTQEADNPIDFPEFDGADSFTSEMIKGKGAYNFPNFTGGEVTIIVDMSDDKNMTVTIMPGAVTPTVSTYIYVVGNNAGWAEPSADNESIYKDWRIACADGSGVYAGTLDLTEAELDGSGNLYCRFYDELAGWGPAKWSSDAAGGNIDVVSGMSYPTFAGEGCFVLAGAGGHLVDVVLDTNTNEVTFTLK